MRNPSPPGPDRPHRFWTALDDSGLNHVDAFTWSIERARDDCIYAGTDPDSCPAVRILTHAKQAKFGSAEMQNIITQAETSQLRSDCEANLERILKSHYLEVIGMRDLTKSAEDKVRFHSLARKALTAAADRLNLTETSWTIQQQASGAFEPGTTRLIAKNFIIEVTAGRAKGANVTVRKRNSPFVEDCRKILIQSLGQLSETNLFAAKIEALTLHDEGEEQPLVSRKIAV
jgi:hypothetical protein